jgi:predicted RNA-binding protein with PUA-like domain
MHYWLMKSEPTCFSIDTLQSLPQQTTAWDGVRNYQARNMMKDQMQKGDLAFFYHSNCQTPGIVGIMQVSSQNAYPDPTQFDAHHDHYDPKAQPNKPIWWLVDVTFQCKFASVISLQALKNQPQLSDLLILRRGNRLSITPITETQWQTILSMAPYSL